MKNHTAFEGENIFIITTMALFSGAGRGYALRKTSMGKIPATALEIKVFNELAIISDMELL